MTDTELDRLLEPHLARVVAAARKGYVPASATFSEGSPDEGVKKAIGKFAEEELDGLRVYYHPNGPKFWVDQMDWHDGLAGKDVIAAAKKAAGVRDVTDSVPRDDRGEAMPLGDRPGVFVMNEGPRPPGEGWVELTAETGKKKFSEGGFTRDDLARFADYFAADADGAFPGNLHRTFGVGVKAFAEATGLVRRARGDGWAWGVRAGQDRDDAADEYEGSYPESLAELFSDEGETVETFAGRTGLVLKEVTDKNGRKTKRWVKANKDELAKKAGKKAEPEKPEPEKPGPKKPGPKKPPAPDPKAEAAVAKEKAKKAVADAVNTLATGGTLTAAR